MACKTCKDLRKALALCETAIADLFEQASITGWNSFDVVDRRADDLDWAWQNARVVLGLIKGNEDDR